MTKIMKTAAYIVLVLGIIAGIYFAVKTESFLVFILYGLLSFMSCLTWFVLVEISEKIDFLSEQVSRTERNIKASTAEQSDDRWTCPKCKKSNPSSQRVCKDCGYNRLLL